MKIGMILNAPYPTDIRVRKEATALIESGFEVYLLCLRRENEKYEDTVEGIRISRIDAGRKNYQLAFWDVIMSLTFVHPTFKKSIQNWVAKNNIDVIHVHDLPLAGTALLLRKKLGVKVIVDLHENYPEALRTWFAWKTNLLAKIKNKIFLNPERWTRYEREAVHKSDAVIAVVDEMKKRLVDLHQVDEKKIQVVTNSEDRAFLEMPLDEKVYGELNEKFIVSYTGGIGPHRGVDTAIEGMQYLKHFPNIVLAIVGSGSPDVINRLKNIVNSLSIQKQVFFLGQQPFNKMRSFMQFASVNIIPHKSNGHTDNTIPHKLYQAMMVGKPLLVSSSTPLKRVVTLANSGLVFEADNAKDFSDKILELYQDETLCSRFGKNGLHATLEGDMNWESEQIKLIQFYSDLQKKSTHRSL